MALSNSTPHIGALKGQIAKRVLMPGDPKRAEWIAKKFLSKPKLVNDVRGMLAFTGKYKNVPVTVMAHGMGIPSLCIYAHELYTFYGVKVIYRVGSCGATIKSKCNLGDVVLCKSCWSDVPVEHWTKMKTDKPYLMFPTKTSNTLIKNTAKKLGLAVKEKDAFSATFFYSQATINETIKMTGSDIIEMEGFGLFLEAKCHKTKAACLLTVSDNVQTLEAMTPAARATTFNEMIKLALESIIKEKV